jgi:hypothetical protein
MSKLSITENNIISSLRYMARLFSVLLIFIVVSLAIGEAFPHPFDLSAKELLFTAALFVLFTGLILAWKWEGLGGSLIIVGFLIFVISNSIISKSLNLGIFLLIFPFTGILYLICCWREKKIISNKK